jgi:hypothetical protein
VTRFPGVRASSPLLSITVPFTVRWQAARHSALDMWAPASQKATQLFSVLLSAGLCTGSGWGYYGRCRGQGRHEQPSELLTVRVCHGFRPPRKGLLSYSRETRAPHCHSCEVLPREGEFVRICGGIPRIISGAAHYGAYETGQVVAGSSTVSAVAVRKLWEVTDFVTSPGTERPSSW